jgi:hypothetical protein
MRGGRKVLPMFSSLFGLSSSAVKEKISQTRLADRIRRQWSFDAFYASIIARVEGAARKGDTAFYLPLAAHDRDFWPLLEERLKADGFAVAREGVSAAGSVGGLLISGWARSGEDEAAGAQGMAVTDALQAASSLWVHHMPFWESALARSSKKATWLLGERVSNDGVRGSDEPLLSDAMAEAHSIGFIGMSGCGKTEGMRSTVATFLAANPAARLSVCDMKATGDWDVFAPFTDAGSVAKTPEEALGVISAAGEELDRRIVGLKQGRHKDVAQWAEVDPAGAPAPLVLVIEELPFLDFSLKWDANSRRPGTAANALFRILTTGRSAGVFLVVGSQVALPDLMPSEIRKNLRKWVVFRVGSEGESMQLLNSPAAFLLGRRGDRGLQIGYAYVDGPDTLVRFHMMKDAAILYALLSAGVRVRSPDALPAAGSRATTLTAPQEVQFRARNGESTDADKVEIERYRQLNELLGPELARLIEKARLGGE